MIWSDTEHVNVHHTASSTRQNNEERRLNQNPDTLNLRPNPCAQTDCNDCSTDNDAAISSGEPNFFIYSCPKSGLKIRVFYFIPNQWRDCYPILFCMHGVQRNAEAYVRNCSDLLIQNGGGKLILICPEFSRDGFPTNWEYNLGNVIDSFDTDAEELLPLTLKPTEDWTFTIIEGIFDRFRELSGSTTEGYHIYGHSAGAQFVHRYHLTKRCICINSFV
jgi:hypothetical protein